MALDEEDPPPDRRSYLLTHMETDTPVSVATRRLRGSPASAPASTSTACPAPSAPAAAGCPASAASAACAASAVPELETLVMELRGDLRVLHGADGSRRYLSLGRRLELWGSNSKQAFLGDEEVSSLVSDGETLYYVLGFSIAAISADNVVQQLAGEPYDDGGTDGPGSTARLNAVRCMSHDPVGRALYLVETSNRIRRVALPPTCRDKASASGAAGRAAEGASSAADGQDGAGAAEAEEEAVGRREAVVSTLPRVEVDSIQEMACYFRPASPSTGPASTACAAPSGSNAGGSGRGGGRDGEGGSRESSGVEGWESGLILATHSALYRWPLELGGSTSAPSPSHVTLLAGAEDEHGWLDGCGPAARFSYIQGLVIDGCGDVIVLDAAAADSRHEGTTAVRRVSVSDGTVTTLVAGLGNDLHNPAILPNGCLAVAGFAPVGLMVLDLGLKPPLLGSPWHGAHAATPPRTLGSDLGSLLDGQPDWTADLKLLVGDRVFATHRAILVARCDYFKQRLAPERFADGGLAELSLPDADPAAFKLLLRFVYTGSADIPPPLAPAVAELADRVLLPELCAEAQAAVLAGVTPEGVVGLMLWAESRGAALAPLLVQLKAWYLDNHQQVRRRARESLKLLARSPCLMVELLEAVEDRAMRRPPPRLA